jgi:hypothetical protein
MVKKIWNIIAMVVGFAAIGFGLYQIPQKYNESGFEVNAKKYLEKGGLLEDVEDEKFRVIEYGDAEFKGRKLKGAVVLATYTMIDRQAGEKIKMCYYIPALLDKEFDAYRSITIIECGEKTNKELSWWKATTKLNGFVETPIDAKAEKQAAWVKHCKTKEIADEITARKLSVSDENQSRVCKCISQRNPEAVQDIMESPDSIAPLGNGSAAKNYYYDLTVCLAGVH